MTLIKSETPDVYDRIRLACPGRNLVLEYIDGHDEVEDTHHDEWRVIDLDTCEVFASEGGLHEVIDIAAAMTRVEGSPAPVYVREARKYITFKEVPLTEKLRHITSHALDLEHDLSLDDDNDNRCPLEEAMKEYKTFHGHACWYQEDDGSWEIDMDVCA